MLDVDLTVQVLKRYRAEATVQLLRRHLIRSLGAGGVADVFNLFCVVCAHLCGCFCMFVCLCVSFVFRVCVHVLCVLDSECFVRVLCVVCFVVSYCHDVVLLFILFSLFIVGGSSSRVCFACLHDSVGFCNRMSEVPEQTRCWEHLSTVQRGQTEGDVYPTGGCLSCELDGMPKREPDEVTQGADFLEKLFSVFDFCKDRQKEERIRRVIIGLLFELGGIPERELNKSKQDEERLEITFYMDRPKEEWERGVDIAGTTKEFFTDKRHYIIIDTPGRRDSIRLTWPSPWNQPVGRGNTETDAAVCRD